MKGAYRTYPFARNFLEVDAKPLISMGGVFKPLEAPEFFAERLTVLNDTVAWDMTGGRDVTACVDIDPCEIFAVAEIVGDPLENNKESA